MKNNLSLKTLIIYCFLTLFLLGLGSGIRILSYNNLFNNRSLFLFSIEHTTNTGSAFGLFENNSFLLALFGIIILCFIAYYVYKNIERKNHLEYIAITLFASGTLGNLIERLRFGYVIDYIKLNFINFPTFNIFDCMISLGVFLYFIFVLYDLRKDYGNSDKSE